MKLSSLLGHIVELLEHTERNNQPTDHTVAEFFRSRKYLGSHDRRFIAQTVYGMIRFRRRLNALLGQYFKEHPPLKQPSSSPAAQYLQFIAYSSAVEEIDPKQIIELLEERRAIFIAEIELSHIVYWMVQNKSLNFVQGDDVRQLADWYSFEEWMVSECVAQFGQEEAEDLLHALNSEAPISLRVNTLKTDVERCRKRLHEEGVETTNTRYSPTGLVAEKRFNTQASAAYKEGWFEIQDEGSQIICQLTEPKAGEFVIDACAGAGGKTLNMAELMQNTGEIIAFDAEPKRLKELEKRAARSGVSIIVTRRVGTMHPGDLLGKADVVLVDAPCSGVGTIRRNPSLKWSVTPTLVDNFARQQAELLDTNASYVKRGGRLVYATCSLLQKENEDVVGKFLERHSDFEPVSPTHTLVKLGIEPPPDTRFVKLVPHLHGTDGFFVAVLARKR
jgi:16S rRNA (cytosine967-C5)-methyltransferase